MGRARGVNHQRPNITDIGHMAMKGQSLHKLFPGLQATSDLKGQN